ncbi:MAG: MaoC family dehydratase [Dehalococcoidia bacterium]|nr:MaoC family dehydratase [Dehalococcoidia bacterium]
MSTERLTGNGNYFEDFHPGDVFEHARSKTMTEMDGVLITNLVMNTAQGHFNEHQMQGSPFGQRIVFGGVTASLVIGLAMQDTGENALAELSMDKVRFRTPVFHGDTITAFTEVLEVRDTGRADAGEVRFRHWGTKHDGKVVFEGERVALIKKRSYWVKP